MGTYNRWDESTFNVHRCKAEKLYNSCKSYCAELNEADNLHLTWHGVNYDPSDQIGSSIRKIRNATGQLNELLLAMDAYLAEYNSMLDENRNAMGNIEVEKSIYGSFAKILAGGTGITNALCALSVACQFQQNGFNFRTDFNDIEAFKENVNYKFFEGVWAVSESGSWEKLTAEYLLDGTSFGRNNTSSRLMEAALTGALAQVPAYNVDTEKLDLEWLGEQLGIPGLSESIENIKNLLTYYSMADGVIDDKHKLTAEQIKEMLKSEEIDEKTKSILKKMRFAEFLPKFLEAGFSVVDAVETVAEMWYHITANHDQQVQYLDSIEEAMALRGYSNGSGLSSMIQEIRNNLANGEDYVLDKFYNEIEKTLKNKLGKAVTEGGKVIGQLIIKEVCGDMPNLAHFNPFKYADSIFDVASLTVKIAGKDQIEAIQTIQGLQMYTPSLISSYESCMELIESGVADDDDVANAENLFQLIRASKMKEYEAMLTLQSSGAMAEKLRQKYAMLEKMGSLDDFITITDMAGSSGGGGRF